MRDKNLKKPITVKCIFSKKDKDAEEIIKKSFASYVKSEVSKTKP